MIEVTPEQFVNILSAALALALIIWFFLPAWDEAIVAWARQRLFVMRDEIFDLAAAGRIGFDHPGYVAVRRHLNHSIRVMHMTNMAGLAFGFVQARKTPGELETLRRAIGKIEDEEVRAEIDRRIQAAAIIQVLTIFFRSPAGWLALIGLVVWLAVWSFFKGRGDDGMITSLRRRTENAVVLESAALG